MQAKTTSGFSSGSSEATISGDGRYIAFTSWSNNLVPGDTNDGPDVFVHNREAGTTARVSVATSGAQTGGPSTGSNAGALSANGRYIAFTSFATNLVPNDTNDDPDIFVRDLLANTTTRVSVSSSGAQTPPSSDGGNYHPSISADGRYIAFVSLADNLAANDTNNVFDVYRHDRSTAVTERVSVATGGGQGNKNSSDIWPASIMSGDGRYVVFGSSATNLVPGDTNSFNDVFVRDLELGTTVRVSVRSDGGQGNSGSGFPFISPSGQYVSFQSGSSNLAIDSNGLPDVFIHDRDTRTTALVSVSTDGSVANGGSYRSAVVDGGPAVAFHSDASNLVTSDSNGLIDVFIRRLGASGPPPPPTIPTLTISPKLGTATVGSPYPVTATLLDSTSPVANADIEFRVTQGPCAGFSGTTQTVRTGATGTASFSYSCGLIGTDTIQASTVASGSSLSDTATVRWERRPGFKYVALGDSYSAGEGADPYFRDGVNRDGIQTGKTDNKCHRSTRAYAEYVQPPGYDRPLYDIASNYFGPPDERLAGRNVNKLGSDANVRSANQVDWVFWACSGAETDNVYQDGTARYQDLRPQLGNVSVKDADLVTITIGGNDLGFVGILKDCFRNPLPCNSASRQSELFARIDGLRPNLEGLYRRVKLVTGSPTVLVLGYPQLFPDTLVEQLCPALLPYTPDEQNFLREAGDRLNGVIQQAAAAAQVTYVEAGLIFRDHEVCGSKGAWINGPSITVKPNRTLVDDESFHPTVQGQRAYAEIINTQLRLRRP